MIMLSLSRVLQGNCCNPVSLGKACRASAKWLGNLFGICNTGACGFAKSKPQFGLSAFLLKSNMQSAAPIVVKEDTPELPSSLGQPGVAIRLPLQLLAVAIDRDLRRLIQMQRPGDSQLTASCFDELKEGISKSIELVNELLPMGDPEAKYCIDSLDPQRLSYLQAYEAFRGMVISELPGIRGLSAGSENA